MGGEAALTRVAAADVVLNDAILAALDAAELTAFASACVVDVAGGRHGRWRSEEDIYPASVIKVPIMSEVYHSYALGLLEPSQRVAIDERNLTATAEPTPFASGYQATVGEMAELMITYSDNVAANQLIDLVGRERVTQYMRSLGLSDFLLGRKLSGAEPLVEDPDMTGRNRMSAADAARLLALIAADEITGSAQQRELLARCAHNDKLVPGLRSGDAFMHKTGETSEVSHDAGILQTLGGKTYVVVLYIALPPSAGGDAARVNPQMAEWMRHLRQSL